MAQMPPFHDMHKMPEGERIAYIGTQAMHGITGLLLEKDQPEKVARYITKVTEGFPGVQHIDTTDGPTPNTVLVRFGPTAAQSAGVNHLNKAPVIDQLSGQWEKIVAMVIHQLAKPGATVSIKVKDIEAYHASGLVLFTHGHADGFSFRLVTREEAAEIAEREAGNRGHA